MISIVRIDVLIFIVHTPKSITVFCEKTPYNIANFGMILNAININNNKRYLNRIVENPVLSEFGRYLLQLDQPVVHAGLTYRRIHEGSELRDR